MDNLHQVMPMVLQLELMYVNIKFHAKRGAMHITIMDLILQILLQFLHIATLTVLQSVLQEVILIHLSVYPIHLL